VSRGFLSLAIGQRLWPGDPDANFRWLLRADNALGSDGLDGASLITYKLLLGVSFGFGGPPPDADGDGVPDRRDKCPDTPSGATVDEKGCPKDSDGDGVYDGIDTCPDTPGGWPVDEKGCPKDSDGDGVPDGKDKCPDTPKGATVDADGCPKDTDGDGVFDGIDRCPDTPKGAKVGPDGCPVDSDGDGVFDGIDRCPDTPKGAKVDATGCPLPEKAPPLFTPEKKSLVLEGVNFEFDSAALRPDSLALPRQGRGVDARLARGADRGRRSHRRAGFDVPQPEALGAACPVGARLPGREGDRGLAHDRQGVRGIEPDRRQCEPRGSGPRTAASS
jgi:hypothetical protein